MRSISRAAKVLMTAGAVLSLTACYSYGHDDYGYQRSYPPGGYDRGGDNGRHESDDRDRAEDRYGEGGRYGGDGDYEPGGDYDPGGRYDRGDDRYRDADDRRPGGAGYGRRYGDYNYLGRNYSGGRWEERGGGGGYDQLDPWLAFTREGQDIVRMGFGGNFDGRIGADTAGQANLWFRRYADTDRDMRLTDEEIGRALVQASRDRPWPRRY